MADKKYSELDSFWAIEKLVPKKQSSRYVTKKRDTDACEISFGKSSVTPVKSSLTLERTVTITPHTESVSDEPSSLFDGEYSPISPLIRHVKLYRWRNNYNYYVISALRRVNILKRTARKVRSFRFFRTFRSMRSSQILSLRFICTGANVFDAEIISKRITAI